MRLLFLLGCSLLFTLSHAQLVSIDLLKQHVYTLADDSYKGRGSGEKGEKKAASYIKKQVKKNGLKAK